MKTQGESFGNITDQRFYGDGYIFWLIAWNSPRSHFFSDIFTFLRIAVQISKLLVATRQARGMRRKPPEVSEEPAGWRQVFFLI